MCLLCSLRAFTEKQPPEGTDLFVCENPADPQKRTYGIMRFFKKGSLFPELMHIEKSSREERLMDALFHLNRSGIPAPETRTGPTRQSGSSQPSTHWILSMQSSIRKNRHNRQRRQCPSCSLLPLFIPERKIHGNKRNVDRP